MAIYPPKILQMEATHITVLSYVDADATEDTVDDYWHQQPYRWQVDLKISPLTHSSPETPTPFFWTGSDIQVGDWIASMTTGNCVQVVAINAQHDTVATLVVEDVERFNTYCDASQSGYGGLDLGSCLLFQLTEEGRPVELGATSVTFSPHFQAQLASRFYYRNNLQRYIRVFQPLHGFQLGDLIAPDANNSNQYVLATSAANTVGVINDIATPNRDWFTFAAFGRIAYNVKPPLTGSFGTAHYLDPTRPGKITSVQPARNPQLVYLQLGSPHIAMQFSMPNGGASTSQTTELAAVAQYNHSGATITTGAYTIHGFFEQSPIQSTVDVTFNGLRLDQADWSTAGTDITLNIDSLSYSLEASDVISATYRY
jgi:hypothetical protein